MFFRRFASVCLLLCYGVSTLVGPAWHRHSVRHSHASHCTEAEQLCPDFPGERLDDPAERRESPVSTVNGLAQEPLNELGLASCPCGDGSASVPELEFNSPSSIVPELTERIEPHGACGDACAICCFYSHQSFSSIPLAWCLGEQLCDWLGPIRSISPHLACNPATARGPPTA